MVALLLVSLYFCQISNGDQTQWGRKHIRFYKDGAAKYQLNESVFSLYFFFFTPEAHYPFHFMLGTYPTMVQIGFCTPLPPVPPFSPSNIILALLFEVNQKRYILPHIF